jgi:hypothetical protein
MSSDTNQGQFFRTPLADKLKSWRDRKNVSAKPTKFWDRCLGKVKRKPTNAWKLQNSSTGEPSEATPRSPAAD